MIPLFRHEIIVQEEAVDVNRHVNNVVYVQWMQDIAVHHYKALGCTPISEEMNATWVVRSHKVEYLLPVFLSEKIIIETWIADIANVRSTRKYRFLRAKDRKLVVRGETNWVYVDLATGRPKQIPDAVRERFSIVAEPS
jgi:acyl-CoA thioester hydrolase